MGALDDWRFCPRCAEPVEPEGGRAECSACSYVAYANPVPAVCALCVDDAGRILLARRAFEPYAGLWDLPGGFLNEEEHPLDGLRRELLEEAGLEIEPVEWFGAFMVPYEGRTVLNLVWQARVERGRARPADDVSELRWFGPAELPPLEEIALPEALRAWRGAGFSRGRTGNSTQP